MEAVSNLTNPCKEGKHQCNSITHEELATLITYFKTLLQNSMFMQTLADLPRDIAYEP